MSGPGRGLPILDAHIHLDPEGSPKEAVNRFLKRGGTHLIVVHKPYHHIRVRSIEDQISSFETTLEMTELANDLGANAWSFIGPYPGELPRMIKDLGQEEAVELMHGSLAEAFRLVKEGRALGIGEIGRVHFPVEPLVQKICDDVLREAFISAGEIDCPIILHTESAHTNPGLMEHLSDMAEGTGMNKERIIKHYSGKDLLPAKTRHGLSISLQCRRENLKAGLEKNYDFLLETDYIDDPGRPNVVMPPDTVPRKIEWAYNSALLDRKEHERLMVNLPKRVLGIDTSL